MKKNERPHLMINWFDDFGGENKFAFLSNFYVGQPITIGDSGTKFATGEHLFQAFKATNHDDLEKVRIAHGPGAAKSIGRRIALREDWEAVKYDVMRMTLACKFHHSRPEADLLLATGDALLVEGTHWGDTVWGVDLDISVAAGRNWLGHLLMAQRAMLRSGIDYSNVESPVVRFAKRRTP